MGHAILNLERRELHGFCDDLPEPIVALPIVTASRGRGMTLALKYPGALVTLTERGRPCRFSSIDDIMLELDGAPNVDPSRLVVEVANWHRA